MSDSAIRELERLAAAGDTEASERLARVCARSGRETPAERKAREEGETRMARVQRVWGFLWRDGSPRIDGLDWYDGLAGEICDGPVIVGNWNNRDRYEPLYGPAVPGRYLDGVRVDTDTTPSRALRVLERLGVDCRWSDGYIRCGCGKGFSTEPDGYGWRQEDYGRIWDGGWACVDCLDESRCETCGEPDMMGGAHCHQYPEVRDGEEWTTAGWCHCGHGCDHDETDDEDEDDDE